MSHPRYLQPFGTISTAVALALAAGPSGRGDDPGATTEGTGGDVVEFGFLGDVNQRKKFKALFTEIKEQYPEIDLQAAAKSGS